MISNCYISAGRDLKSLNLGEHLSNGDFIVYPEGISFIRERTFISVYKENVHQRKKEKIEFYLKILGGIAAALGILCGFVKSCS